MRQNFAEIFREDLIEFREATRKFYNKEIPASEYKGISGAFGSYSQRGGELGMLRLRICGGRLTKDYLKFLINSIDKYNINLIHLTTCQSIQLHNLHVDDICTIVEEAWDNGFITRGGGGDYPRNVMVTPLTGVEKEEAFDLTPYASIASDYLLSFIKKVKMPRKLKVAFSSTPENWPHATFRDLGFVANENKKFDVYCAGGLGPNPMMGVCVAEDVEPTKILYYIKAMIDTFCAHGNYEKRTQARTRYMQKTLGEDGLKKAYQEKLDEALASEDLDITIDPCEVKKTGDDITFTDRRVVAQKQKGLYAVEYHPMCGNISPEKWHEIYNTIKDMDEVEIRITPNESIYFINCTADEAKTILGITEDGARTTFETSVACIGASICQIGLRDSQELLRNCIEAVRPYNFADGVLPKIRISGCLSSCGCQQVGTIGFRGTGKKTEEGLQPAFAMFEDGCQYYDEEQFGGDVGVMLTTDIPKFFIELGQAVSADNSVYDKWIIDHHDKMIEIAKKYC